MKYFTLDIEANGLDVHTVDIHCVVLKRHGKTLEAFRPHETHKGIARINTLLDDGEVLVAHNGIKYDIPVLLRYGMRVPGPNQVYDTLVASRAAYPGNTLGALDKTFLLKNPQLRGELMVGGHSLKAWGLRLGCPKDEYDGGWDHFNEEMFTYCQQDVESLEVLFDHLQSRIPDEAAFLDNEVARVCYRMQEHGVAFDREKAEKLVVELTAERHDLTVKLREMFPAWWAPKGTLSKALKTPKRNLISRKYKPGEADYQNVRKGCSYTSVEQVEFNPASTQHIADRLQRVHNWKPRVFTDGGAPKLSADILKDLPFPEAPVLARYQEIKKILGYLSEGQNAWLKLEKDGRLHGTVNPTGASSTRASHNKPNLANVPTRSDLGHKCRELFMAPKQKVIVGADASGLQLRGLANYLGRWDGGVYAEQILDGDIHTFNQKAIGLHFRDNAKTFVYALLFGAGAGKLGETVLADIRQAIDEGLIDGPAPSLKSVVRLGKAARARLGAAIPAFDELAEALKSSSSEGFLKALDGRRVPIASDHVALAMLLQSAEACIMKKAMVLAAPALYDMGVEFWGWIHDEFQCEAPVEVAEAAGEVMVKAMNEAGEYFNQRIRIDGEYKIGPTWAETH